jgi:hypothetical protein
MREPWISLALNPGYATADLTSSLRAEGEAIQNGRAVPGLLRRFRSSQ